MTEGPEEEEVPNCANVIGMIEDGVQYQCRGLGEPEFSAELTCLHYDACFDPPPDPDGDLGKLCAALAANCPDVDEHPEPRLLFKKLFEFTFGNHDEPYEEALVAACRAEACGPEGEACDLEKACEGACANMVCESVPELLELYRSSAPFVAGICCSPGEAPGEFNCQGENVNEGPLLDVCNGVIDVWIQQTSSGFSSFCLREEQKEAEGNGGGCYRSFFLGSCDNPTNCSCDADCDVQGTCCFDLCATEARATTHKACWQGDCKVRKKEMEPAFFQDIDTELVVPDAADIPVFVRNAKFDAQCKSVGEPPVFPLPEDGGGTTAGGGGPLACTENVYDPALPFSWPTTLDDIETLGLVPAGTHTFHATGQATIRPSKLLRDVLKDSGEDVKVAKATIDLSGDGMLAFDCEGQDCEFRLSRFVVVADPLTLAVKPPPAHDVILEFARMYVDALSLDGTKSGNKVKVELPEGSLFAPIHALGSITIDTMVFRGERLAITRNDAPSTIKISGDDVHFSLVFSDQWFTVDVVLSAPLVPM